MFLSNAEAFCGKHIKFSIPVASLFLYKYKMIKLKKKKKNAEPTEINYV